MRVVSKVVELNRRLHLNLTEHDINYVYSLQDSKTLGFYFKTYHGEVRLISYLLDSDKESEGDYPLITRNWFPNELPCPISLGRAGG